MMQSDTRLLQQKRDMISTGILSPMSKEMIADCLNHSGYADDLAIGTSKCLLNLLNKGEIEIYWNNRENELYISLPDDELLKLAGEKTQ